MSSKNNLQKLAALVRNREFEPAVDLIKKMTNADLYTYRYEEPKPTVKGDCTMLHIAAASIFPQCDPSAASISSNNDPAINVLTRIVDICPRLLIVTRRSPYEGQTPLHTLISKGYVEAVEVILGAAKKHRCLVPLLETSCTGAYFEDTVMMGQLPLSIAALTFNKAMVKLLLEYKAEIKAQNALGDTVFHSLIRYSCCFPKKQDLAENMMNYLHRKLYKAIEKRDLLETALQTTWLIENHKERFTALKLAAYLWQPKLFTYIFELSGVYRHLGGSLDGLFNVHLYDITEIDSAANTLIMKKKNKETKKEKRNVVQTKPNQTEPMQQETVTEKQKKMPKTWTYEEKHRVVSVFEILSETQKAQDTFDILEKPVIATVLDRKWKSYRKYFFSWFVAHTSVMAILSAYSVEKSEVMRSYLKGSVVEPSTLDKTFVTVSSIMVFIISCIILVGILFVFGWRYRGNGLHWTGRMDLYKLLLFIFALCLFIDSIWYWSAQVPKNYFLIVGLLIGWWFMTFFLRPYRKFAFFTVMLRKILTGDMIRFSSIILVKLVAFTLAMHAVFMLTAGPPHEDFSTVWRTALTMFKLLLGLEEMQMLYEAPEPWLAIVLFSVFVLLTYVLMLNSLIALMSSTAAEVEKNKEKYWMSQKLSVLMVIEAALPAKFTHCVGFTRIYEDSGTRYLIEARSLPMDLTTKKKTKKVVNGYLEEVMTDKLTNTMNCSKLTKVVRSLVSRKPEDTGQQSSRSKDEKIEKKKTTFKKYSPARRHSISDFRSTPFDIYVIDTASGES